MTFNRQTIFSATADAISNSKDNELLSMEQQNREQGSDSTTLLTSVGNGDSNNTLQQSTKGHFPFFDLPIELRDLVYDLLLGEEKCLYEPEHEAALSIKHYPRIEIQLVNKQLRREYLKQIEGRATVIFGDHIGIAVSHLRH